jgi:5-formyltetrahydrofolate cyclo-ligase
MTSLTSAAAAKNELRGEVRARREALSARARADASAAICRRAFEVIANARPEIVAAYHAIGAEADPAALVTQLAVAGFALVLPASSATDLMFRRYRPGDPLGAGGFGTLAPPVGTPEVDPDFLVVPLVAFDRRGFRLGNGRGHFDRAISSLHKCGRTARCLGIAFATQEVATVPDEPHDEVMDWIVTENEVIEPGAGARGG